MPKLNRSTSQPLLPENDQTSIGWRFDNSYTRLPAPFFVKCKPMPVREPSVVLLNDRLAESLGLSLSHLRKQDVAALFAGNILPSGAEPIAQAYAGHQFGGFTMLGDGRAILLGEQLTISGERFDIQLKGSGQTPFSRRGDGRAALGPMLREYMISEAMHSLGIPTTRSLAVVMTGEPVYREKTLQGAILTRVAASHIRVGTFEYLAARNDTDGLRILADYTIRRHYPEVAHSPNPYLDLLQGVIQRQAALVARWMHVGFVHGVMNTDNMAISGETIDYGPCAFMDRYDPATVFSSIDTHGRYAYGNQHNICHWNLVRFAEALLPLLDPEQSKAIAMATELLEKFPATFEHYWLSGMRRKLGLTIEEEGDLALVQSLLNWMQKSQADYTNTFRDLATELPPSADLYRTAEFLNWHSLWQDRLTRNHESKEASLSRMCQVNPVVIPRNHRVEEALELANEQADFSLVHRLLDAISTPYDNRDDHIEFRTAPAPSPNAYQTFCGT